MKMVDNEWMDKFIPREYKRRHNLSGSGEQDVSKDNNFGYSEQGMKDLDEVRIGCEVDHRELSIICKQYAG